MNFADKSVRDGTSSDTITEQNMNNQETDPKTGALAYKYGAPWISPSSNDIFYLMSSYGRHERAL